MSLAVLQTLLSLALLAVAVYTLFIWRNASKKLTICNERNNERFASALGQLDRIFKRRTGLSGDLMDAAAGQISSADYDAKVHTFLKELVDDLQVLFSDFTESKCTVTIKLLVQTESSENLNVVTAYRDRESAKIRTGIYRDFEPYSIEEHSLIRRILESSPFCEHVSSDDLRSLGREYRNPNPDWNNLFNASAIHAIVSPDNYVTESVFGFLCIDNKGGRLSTNAVTKLMSISSTAVFYVLSASSILNDLRKRE